MITKKQVKLLKKKMDNREAPSMPWCLSLAFGNTSDFWRGTNHKFDPKDYLNKALIELGLINEKGNRTKKGNNYEKTICSSRPDMSKK